MTKIEYMLTRDIGNWLFYAMNTLGIKENEAILMWNNKNNVGKKLICESRGEDSDRPDTRVFIRNVTNAIADTSQKKGWWNTFTIAKGKIEKGLYLAEVVSYRLDRNGYLNSEVKVIMPVNDVTFHTLFSEKEGTWKSIAWWLMMVVSEAFLKEYKFSTYCGIHRPNFEELKKCFPEFNGLEAKEIGEKALYMYISGKISIREIEECLNTPDDWEQLILEVSTSVLNNTTETLYGCNYPIFAKKAPNSIKNGLFTFIEDNTDDYIRRQVDYYNELLKDGKIEPVVGDVLDIVEAALAYRKSLKDAEKAEKKRQKKNK